MFTSLSSDVRRTIARAFGRYLAALHDAFRFDGYGSVIAVAGETPARLRASGPDNWSEWFRAHALAGIADLPSAFDDLRAPLEETVKQSSYRPAPPSRLYPWDLRQGNSLVSNDQISALIDWGEPLSATPSLSLAKTEHLVADWYLVDSASLRTAIRDGYRSVRSLPAVERIDRLVAVVRSAVDSRGQVTRPGYPERRGADAISVHRRWIQDLL